MPRTSCCGSMKIATSVASMWARSAPSACAIRIAWPSCCSIDAAGRPAIRGAYCGDHRVVVGEAARRQHHPAACADGHVGAVPSRADAGDTPVGFDDQPLHPDVVQRLHARCRRGLHERLHQHEAGAGLTLLLVRHLRDVTARRRGGDRVERIGVLPAAVHQSFVAHRLPAGLPEELGLERHPALDEPVEVTDAAVAVVGDATSRRRPDPSPHSGRRPCCRRNRESAGLLERSSAAEIDEAAGHRRGATPGAGALEDEDVGACRGQPPPRRRLPPRRSRR